MKISKRKIQGWVREFEYDDDGSTIGVRINFLGEDGVIYDYQCNYQEFFDVGIYYIDQPLEYEEFEEDGKISYTLKALDTVKNDYEI